MVSANDPVLRARAQEVPLADIGTPAVRSLIADMKRVLEKEEYGVALAAPQVGASLRLFIVSGKALVRPTKKGRRNDESPKAKTAPPPPRTYINPVLTKLSREKSGKHEGCLSIRGFWGVVPRAEKATITAYDEQGVKFTEGASGLLAHIFQHEIDHLEGTLYTDKTTELYAEDKEKTSEAAAS